MFFICYNHNSCGLNSFYPFCDTIVRVPVMGHKRDETAPFNVNTSTVEASIVDQVHLIAP